MSYILDALNKADQARKQQLENVPPPPSTASSSVQSRGSQTALFALLACTLGLLLYWFVPRPVQQAEQEPVAVMADTQEKVVVGQIVVSTVEQPGREQLPPAQTDHNEEPATALQQPELPPETEAAPESMLTLMELPQSVLDRLPPIKISAHTFSPNQAKRMVIINDKVLRENRNVSEQLLLKSITRQGVALEFDGTLFSMSVYDSWPY